MTSEDAVRKPPQAKLMIFAETVLAEAALLRITDSRFFALPMDAERAGTLRHDIELAERVHAFAAHFGRLQDTVGNKLLPLVLAWLSEPVGPAIDNVARAERLGWIDSASEWIECGDDSGDSSKATARAEKCAGSKAAQSSSWVSGKYIERKSYLALLNIASMSCANADFRSALIVPRPARKPSVRVVGNTSAGTAQTIGLLALATTNS